MDQVRFRDLAELADRDLADRSEVLDGDVRVRRLDRSQTGLVNYFRIGPGDAIPQQFAAGHHVPAKKSSTGSFQGQVGNRSILGVANRSIVTRASSST